MPSRRFRWLAAKEFRELMASRAFWLLLLMIGPLVGHGFITAVDTYAEASGIAGGPAALAQGLSPLDGILVPAFGAYDLAVTLLFPFVAIRLVAVEKASGAWKLLLQSPASAGTMLLAKGLILLAGWLIAWIPGLCALVLWRLYGGTLYAAGGAQPSARPPAALRARVRNRRRRGRHRQRSGLRRHRDPGFHGRDVGSRVRRRRPRRPAAEGRVLHSQRRAAPLRAGTISPRDGRDHRRHRRRRICPRRHLAPAGPHHSCTRPRFRRHPAGVRSHGRRRRSPAHRVGPEREPPQQLFRRRRGRPRPHPSTPARHRLTSRRKTRASSIWTATSSPNSHASCPMSRSSTPPVPAPDCSKPPATITAKSGTNSAGRKSMTRSTTEPIVLDNLYQLAQTPAAGPRRERIPRPSAARRSARRRLVLLRPLAACDVAFAGWVHLRVWS